MCGRYALTLPPAAVRAWFRYVDQPDFPPRDNIAPTQPVAILRCERQASGQAVRRFALVRWAFVPAFVKHPKEFPLLFNARAETAAQKASFRAALARRRCLFIADGFYEWRRATEKGRGGSVPYLFRRRDLLPLAFAGIYETWIGPNGEEVDGACILTIAANADVAPVHERMPGLMDPSRFDAWLDPGQENAGRALALMGAPAVGELESTQVDPRGRGAAVVQAEPDGKRAPGLF